MKYLVLALLFIAPDPREISRVNNLKEEAGEAFNAGDFEAAISKYSTLYDTLGVDEPEIGLNLAHSYYALGDSSNAKAYYQKVTTGNDTGLNSIAYQQLGVMAKAPSTLQQSLAYFKSALKADPTNEEARYNYEVVKKLLEEQQKQNQDQQKDDQNKEQENKDQQKEDQKNQEGEKSKEEQESEKQEGEKSEEEQKEQKEQDGEESEQEQQDQQNQEMNTRKKLEEMNISEEKAQMILEAMKNNEIQYIQQQKRKATKRPDSGKPDW